MQVERWHVVFHMKRHEHLLEKLVRGRFGHVSAFAHLIGPGVWLMIDFSPLTGPHCVLWPFLDDPHQMPLGLAEWTANASILKAIVRRKRGFAPKWGLYCVPFVKQLVGSTSRALSPEGLWRDLQREGAEVVYNAHERAAAAARPDPRSAIAARPVGAAEGGVAEP
jgi:hypothetical protein